MVTLFATDELKELEGLLRDTPRLVLAERIREARGVETLDALGERMGGVYRQTLIGYEQAKHKPRLPMLLRLAEVTGRDPRWFLGMDDAPFRTRAA